MWNVMAVLRVCYRINFLNEFMVFLVSNNLLVLTEWRTVLACVLELWSDEHMLRDWWEETGGSLSMGNEHYKTHLAVVQY